MLVCGVLTLKWSCVFKLAFIIRQLNAISENNALGKYSMHMYTPQLLHI